MGHSVLRHNQNFQTSKHGQAHTIQIVRARSYYGRSRPCLRHGTGCARYLILTVCSLRAALPTIGSSHDPAHDAATMRILRGDVLRADVPGVPSGEPDSVRIYLCYDVEGA